MSDTTVQECKCCRMEHDCIDGLCEMCSDFNYRLQKQSDLLTLGLLQEKRKVVQVENESCDICRFWRPKECRRHSPIVIIDGYDVGSSGHLTVYPEISENSWCGEFEAKARE